MQAFLKIYFNVVFEKPQNMVESKIAPKTFTDLTKGMAKLPATISDGIPSEKDFEIFGFKMNAFVLEGFNESELQLNQCAIDKISLGRCFSKLLRLKRGA